MPRFFIHPDIAQAHTPHIDLYTDPVLFEQTKEKLFAPSWQFIGDTSFVPAIGDAYPFSFRSMPEFVHAGLNSVNLAYLYVLPIGVMAGSSMVAADAMEKALGVSGAGVVAGLIIVSAFGATQNNLLTNARIVFAMGEGRAFFPWTGKVHPRWGTPGNVEGPAQQPPAPLAFIVFTLFYLGTTLYNDIAAYSSDKSPIINSVLGLLLTATGVPFYWYFQRQKRKT
jgi:hypothetical protein